MRHATPSLPGGSAIRPVWDESYDPHGKAGACGRRQDPLAAIVTPTGAVWYIAPSPATDAVPLARGGSTTGHRLAMRCLSA
jgi:hypothetical protein